MIQNAHTKGSSFRRYTQNVILYYSKHSIRISFVVVAIFICVMAFSLQQEEPKHENGFWRATVYILSGMDVDEPYTTEGRVIAVCLLICGTLAASLFTGLVAAQFSRLLSVAQNIPIKSYRDTFRGHVVIFGWSEKTKAILRELDQVYKELGFWARKIIIVSDREQLPKGQENIYDHVWHICGVSTDESVLKCANLSNNDNSGAQMSIILSNPSLPTEEADRQSLLTALAIEHMAPSSICIAEGKLKSNVVHFKNACVNQTIIPDDYANLLLARTAAFPGLTSYVDELLSLTPRKIGSENKPLLFFDIKDARTLSVDGLCYNYAILELYKNSSLLLCGMKMGDKILLFPDLAKKEAPLKKEDLLLVIAKKAQYVSTTYS